MKSVSVLLSLFGDAGFLPGLMQSLQAQSCQDFQLVYRVDGHADFDGRCMQSLPEVIRLKDQAHCGVVLSYSRLIADAPDSRWYMLADQDDFWHPDKIEKSIIAMQNAEKTWGQDVPLLIHSDLRIVRADLTEIAPSMMRYQALDPRRSSLKDLMVQNNVTGCTVMFNRALRDMASIPAEALCHDWYLALIAAAFGQIGFLPDALVDYRQHSANVYGAVARRKLLTDPRRRNALRERLQLTQKQAKVFLEQFREQLSDRQISTLEAWSRNLEEPSYCKRLFNTWRGGFAKNDRLRTIGMWFVL